MLALGLGGGDKIECVLSAQGPWDLSLWGGNSVPEKERNSTLVGVELGGGGRELGGPGMRLEREVVITWRPLVRRPWC